MATLTRRVLFKASAAVAMPWIARAAEPDFRLKFGDIVSGDHPLRGGFHNYPWL